MKLSIIIFALIVIIAQIDGKIEYDLSNLIRTSLRAKADPLLLPSTRKNDESTADSMFDQDDTFERENHFQSRNTFDSGEDYYFQWARKNRRPVEYLTGRKRGTTETNVPIPARARRIKGGIWRSGLVG